MTDTINLETAKQYYIDRLSGELSSENATILNNYLEKNPTVRDEFEMLELIWKATDIQKRPPKSPEMSKQLQDKLKDAAHEEGEELDLNFDNQ